MKRRRSICLAALGAAGALGLAACSSGSNASSDSSPSSAINQTYNAGNTSVVNPSTHRGGTLTIAYSGTPDSFDGGNAYYAWVLNFSRLYETPLIVYKSCPGACGLQAVPGLATSLGQVSDRGLIWTYHIKQGVTFQDGTPVTAQDVKYAVERTYDRSVLANGPTYFQVLLKDPGYPGPYKDRAKNLMGLTSITTPDKYTIQFHLQKPFPDFNNVVSFPQTAPVPPNKDTGSSYQLDVISTGPYEYQSYQLNNQLTLVRNPRWKPYWDPQANPLPSKIIIYLNRNPNTIDNQLLAGRLDLEAAGLGVQTVTRVRILTTPSLEKNADDALGGNDWLVYINTKVAPLNNVHCRRAVEYAANKTTLQTAYGGPIGGGAIASTVMPPSIIGHEKFDLYEATTKPWGDLAKARQELKACGHPNGFTTGTAYRTDRPPEVQAAQALQQALARVGINLQLHGYPAGSYYSNFAGVPNYVHQHDLGLDFGGWVADWPNGFGFLDQISNGNTIVSSGNTNIAELNDPLVNKMFAESSGPTISQATRTALWPKIDRRIMTDAAILPMLYAKQLLYRSPDLTNVYVQPYYGMYNDIVLGVK
jgi:peptide/nickel transport system substrate-binding protein